MRLVSKTALLLIPIFILVSFIATPAMAGKKHKHWKKEKVSAYKKVRNDYREDWRDEIRYEQGHHHHGCNLPPGLAKKGKIPPGWAKKCQQQEERHHARRHHDHYPNHDHTGTSRRSDKPTVDGSVDIGVGIHIPFP